MTVRFNTVDVGRGVGLSATIFRDAQRARLDESGVSFSERRGNDAWLLPVPATFIVGQDGLAGCRFVDVDFPLRAEPPDMINAVRPLAGRD
jgi:hypothetical protein